MARIEKPKTTSKSEKIKEKVQGNTKPKDSLSTKLSKERIRLRNSVRDKKTYIDRVTDESARNLKKAYKISVFRNSERNMKSEEFYDKLYGKDDFEF